ncbi:MAG: hypothetical protein IJO87_03255 [Eggerthellaceae bacterium]|nr:hypothetical protein [Eggerthellaceae bacterium]
MTTEFHEIVTKENAKRCALYLAKALLAVGALYAVAEFLPAMHPVGISILWAILSLALGIGFAYHRTIRKLRRQLALEEGSLASRINGGRLVCLAVAFAASAVMAAGLLLESPKWGSSEWAIVFLSVPVYGIARISVSVFAKGWKKPFRASVATVLASLVTGAFLCLLYLIFCSAEPVAACSNAAEAFASVRQPFAESPSALLSEAGMLVALTEGLTAYGMSEAAGISPWVYLAWRVVLCGSAFFGVSFLLGTCTLGREDAKLALLPLSEAASQANGSRPVPKYAVVSGILPVILIVGFLVADYRTAEMIEGDERTAFEEIAFEHASMAASAIDGSLYDKVKVQELIESARLKSADLALEREAVLVPLINEAYDKRLENVDGYLDWYYSLSAEYETLIRYFTGDVEDGMRDQLSRRINEGVDDSVLIEQIGHYAQRSAELEAELEAELGRYEVLDVPQWLISDIEILDEGFLSEPLAPTLSFLGACDRLGLTDATEAGARIIANKAVGTVAAKPVFKEMVELALKKLTIRGLVTGAGTLVAPGVGTAAATGASVAVDYLFLKGDEMLNRDEHRAEIVAAIEESRAEMLMMARAS